jgi:hypothetical protein
MQMSQQQKVEMVWAMLHGEKAGNEGSFAKSLDAASTKFKRFCDWIKYTVCEEMSQEIILKRQQEYCLGTFDSGDTTVVARLRQIHFSPWSIPGGDPASLVATFWALYHACEDNALADFNATMNTRVFDAPLRHLCYYKDLLHETKWEGPIVVVSALQSVLRSQIKIIIQKHQLWSFERWYNKREKSQWTRQADEEPCWKYMSPLDWSNVYGSILLVANDRYISTRMGKEKIMLENLQQKAYEALFFSPESSPNATMAQTSVDQSSNTFQRIIPLRSGGSGQSKDKEKVPFSAQDGCPSLAKCLEGFYSLKDGRFVPKYPSTYSCVGRMEIPSNLGDPSHFGHVAYVYRNVLASIGKR